MPLLSSLLRPLRTRPGFAVVVILTLGLTIGAATTVFSLFDAVLLRPLPFDNADRLVRIQTLQNGRVDGRRGIDREGHPRGDGWIRLTFSTSRVRRSPVLPAEGRIISRT